MSEAAMNTAPAKREHKLNYTGRFGQVIIYLGKLLRGFVYQSDWKVLPMAALIAGVVSMVVHRDFFITMEGTLKGALALTCLSIWNGCFNSIQVVCREREIIKREHRSGLHISAYIFSHMIYQALLCLLQTIITLFVCSQTGVKFPTEGLFSNWMVVDLGITIFLITYASDMLSLWISCLTRSTTTAMTVMPFVLIFQLVFSGGIFTLPDWANRIAFLSISNYGMKCIAAQSNYNGRDLVSGWNSLDKVKDKEISGTITLGEVMDFLTTNESPLVRDLRATEVRVPSAKENAAFLAGLTNRDQLPGINEILGLIQPSETDDSAPEETVSFGKLIDTMADTEYIQSQRGQSYTYHTTIDELMSIYGKEKLKTDIIRTTSTASRVEAYRYGRRNIGIYWVRISLYIVLYSCLSVLFLEFVDKDKR